jgi:hypothetical protein
MYWINLTSYFREQRQKSEETNNRNSEQEKLKMVTNDGLMSLKEEILTQM